MWKAAIAVVGVTLCCTALSGALRNVAWCNEGEGDAVQSKSEVQKEWCAGFRGGAQSWQLWALIACQFVLVVYLTALAYCFKNLSGKKMPMAVTVVVTDVALVICIGILVNDVVRAIAAHTWNNNTGLFIFGTFLISIFDTVALVITSVSSLPTFFECCEDGYVDDDLEEHLH